MSSEEFVGVILSAGKGRRIDPFSTSYPKPLLPICNRPIMEYQIDYLRELGITRIIVVVGHLKERIMEALGDGSHLGVHIRYVEQKQTLGIAHAVMQLERYIHSPFFLFLGDIFYVPTDLREMIDLFKLEKASGVLAVKREDQPEAIFKNFSVDVDEELRVHKVVEKPRYSINNLKGCGIYLFGPEVFDAIRQTPRTAMRDEYEITTSIQILIDSGRRVFASEVIRWDLKITYPKDLLNCNRMWMEMKGITSVISQTATLHPECAVEDSVIGDNVIVETGIRIVRSLVLPNARISSEEDIHDSIISDHLRIRCK
jgi:NDP-sugar pyrophosphorylase family protein